MQYRNTLSRMFVAFITAIIFVFYYDNCSDCGNANAQTLEVQIRYSEAEWTTAYDLYTNTHFGGSNFGIQTFGVVSAGWAELYTGPTYAPTPWLELSLMGGVQTTGHLEPRYATSLWAGHDRFATLAWVEFDHNGANGVWYDVTAKYQALDWLSAGLRVRRFFGVGPTVWVAVPKTPLGVWLSWTPVGFEETIDLTRGVGGITFTF
jgi:hypothetical protein